MESDPDITPEESEASLQHSEAHYRLFFGKRADSYMEVVKKIANGKKFVFNVPAFFLGMFWMAYRKMYREIVVVFVFLALEGFVEAMILEAYGVPEENTSIIDLVITIIWSVLLGFYSNYLFVAMANREISKVLELNLPEEEADALIAKNGGTSFIGVVALVLNLMPDFGHGRYVWQLNARNHHKWS